MRILVIGDYINDVYTFGKATRLCPEAPVPVIVPERYVETDGGAGLVYRQLQTLQADVRCYYGSYSKKRRFFVGPHLVCRVDEDSNKVEPLQTSGTYLSKFDAFVVSDYGKGAMLPSLARQIVETAKPCFVDAKHHWDWYDKEKCYWFPNCAEYKNISEMHKTPQPYIVQKRGAHGCSGFGLDLPATVSEVVDTTGAGDIFMAGFVYAWTLNLPAEDCLRFANEIAGESCRHIGTFVVSLEFAQSVLDRLRPSQVSGQQAPVSSPGSTLGVFQPPIPRNQVACWTGTASVCILPSDWFEVPTENPETLRSFRRVRTLPQSPLGPIGSSGAQSLEGSSLSEGGTKAQTTQHNQNPSES